ncbi:hypothetical protein P9B03_10885 [Metasolibacillus meyeri]|uniref:Uncharacterized protein n=1 Tax=Metasolibacillus meyeri TaxID=1071052 RepID=A0AAW9NUK7_9BACL|nr:hypothetical protein [Metasolibacillus meyeri]MEC1178989.1 hypothetical protein [Metasolibacillus meyeri]
MGYEQDKLMTVKDLQEDAPNQSFADKLYEQITSVIGGNNAQQFFCMSLPGTLIDASQYTYDIENNEPKPAYVRANESKLVNKLFDACQMTASDNGRHLSTQFKTALDMLTPKLNSMLFEAKNKLREVLMTPYPYNFGDGKQDVLTLEQVFYRLYSEYVNTKQVWAEKQVAKKNELAKKYPENTAEAYKRRNNEFLDWYEITAEAEVLGVEEKLGKVLGVFSPGDMEIINGILDSGVGREIAEARSTIANVGKMNPDGGHVYPVQLYPENWFSLLNTSFTPVDLLESPAALAQQLAILVAQRSNITSNINSFLAIIPEEDEVKALKAAYEASDAAFKTALATLQETYVNTTVDMLKTLVDVMASQGLDDVKKVLPSTVVRIFGVEADKVEALLGKLGDSLKNCFAAQQDLIEKAQKATNAAMRYFEENNKLQFKSMLMPLQQQLENTNQDIAALKEKIGLATLLQPTKESSENDVAPNHVPENFTQIILTSSLKEANQASSSYASASTSNYGVSFFFGGYSSSSSHKEAINKAFSSSSDMSIQIGMSVAKVQIGREWFNPGVFLLTEDMYNTSSKSIAPAKDYQGFSKERFDEMNQCVFPCFPTAFIIARDVTIKFTTASAMSDSFAQSVEEHSSRGGGFFVFGGSRSSSSSSSQSNSSVQSSANSVTVRFTNPQILGYYLEATATDKSVRINTTEASSNTEFISIFEFVTKFQEMLDDYNQKYNGHTLNL